MGSVGVKDTRVVGKEQEGDETRAMERE